MSTVREFVPKLERKAHVPVRTFPTPTLMEEFLEGYLPRWMEPFGWRWPTMFGEFPRFEGKLPLIDIIDHDTELVVRAELPGVKKEELDISVTDEYLTIKTLKEKEVLEEEEKFYRHEMLHGLFERTIPLPMAVEVDKIKAVLKDGILEILIPKTEKVLRHKVTIQ